MDKRGSFLGDKAAEA